MLKNSRNDEVSMRLDKWLWCARFYKTRSLATAAVREGKIKLNQTKAKPAKLVQVGDKIEVRARSCQYDITVNKLGKSRGSSAEATLLFQESTQSIEKRETQTAQFRLTQTDGGRTKGRPDKRQRREIIRFTRK